MTIIFSQGNIFWIERLVARTVDLAAAATVNININFERSGFVVSLSGVLSVPFDGSALADVEFALKTLANAEITTLPTPTVLNGIRVNIVNNSAAMRTITVLVTVMLRNK